MGTNYYVRNCDQPCQHCAADLDGIHLGKSSGGWRFLFRAQHDWDHEQAFTEWLKLATSGGIFDEYGRPVSIGQLLATIHTKADGRSHLTDTTWADALFAADGHEFTAREFS